MAFELPKLPYDLDALAPAIDKRTMNSITESTIRHTLIT